MSLTFSSFLRRARADRRSVVAVIRIQNGPTSLSLGVSLREMFIHIVTIAGTLGRLELGGSFSSSSFLLIPAPSP